MDSQKNVMGPQERDNSPLHWGQMVIDELNHTGGFCSDLRPTSDDKLHYYSSQMESIRVEEGPRLEIGSWI
ncbi:hypothetical protein TNCV_3628641 [Trichonephila clavipes]|nr:hypothetical protein TNCV_3628641 [Trichonephila clavipes]